MFAAEGDRQGAANANPAMLMALEDVLLLVGLVLTFQAYRRGAV